MSQLPTELCNIPPELFPQSDDERYLRFSHNERWEHLKPVIIKLYTCNYGKNNKPLKIPQIVSFMKTYYYFRAAENEYPHKFRDWGVSGRRLTKAIVDEIVAALGRRSETRLSTSRITLKRGQQEENLDIKRVKRHLGDSSSSARPEMMQTGWLSSWPLPYAAFVSALPRVSDAPSPYGTQAATPGYLRINDSETTSPRNEEMGPSPNTQLLLQKARDYRTSLFLQGRLKDLITSMSQEDRRICVDYFHEFYMHGFITAKNWGSPTSILHTHPSPAFTPSAFLQFPPSPLPPESPARTRIQNLPTPLCRWCVHVKEIHYEALPDELDDTDPPPRSFANSLQSAIATGGFTDLRNDNLPLSHETVIESLTQNPLSLQLDACKLAIMAGNSDLLFDLCGTLGREEANPKQIHTIYPYHLAASFLNGGGPCCTIFGTLATVCQGPFLIRHNVNELGHTVLDSLLVSVLRSHTSVKPETVSYEFGALSRFPGEEKDICGRWDADSPEVRELFAKGSARIPTSWKHPFCHSAVQAICHSSMIIFGTRAPADVNCLSGLFLRRCTECGLELKLGPLHSLVVTAFFLCQSGMEGETLFGPVAILICLMSMGADITMRANISLEEIIRSPETGLCRHRPLTAAEMMQSVPQGVVESWSGACQAGWDTLLHTFMEGENNPAHHENDIQPPSEVSGDGSDIESEFADCELGWEFHDATRVVCSSKKIGLLWATIQTEFLTHRRAKTNDPWISDYFRMGALRAWLRDEVENFDTPLVSSNMMRRFSRCGWFHLEYRDPFVFATASDVCQEWFANIDDYKRTQFVHVPELGKVWF